MRLPIAAIAGVMVLSASLASAQTGSGTSGGAAGSANPTVPPSLGVSPSVQAPVGHFQPRKDSVPSENGYQESAQDRALDRKIKSICRGC
ncbi:MAG: hypothetical protein K2W78_08885 [Xanthobacteraceae bacterium]|nr:hypothetical protein [Xanthobacteraceae bacterium]